MLLGIALLDTFESIVLPRTVTRRLRLARLFYRTSWKVWKALGRLLPEGGRREAFLGAYGPLSLLLLLAVWAFLVLFSFALIQWGINSTEGVDSGRGFGVDLYVSGITMFTVGYGDVTPHTSLTRTVSVIEAGIGLGFLAIVIGYLPVIYQSFSRREVGISLLDARAGSPPTAVELLRRHGQGHHVEALHDFLKDWERWSADILESHLSYPVLVYYRSQHDRESWLASLTTMLDTCAVLNLRFRPDDEWTADLQWQAQLTFAMSRHVIIDLALVVNAPPVLPEQDRLPSEAWARTYDILIAAGVPLGDRDEAETRLAALRRQYEPYVHALSQRLLLTLPPFSLVEQTADDWQRSAWESLRHF